MRIVSLILGAFLGAAQAVPPEVAWEETIQPMLLEYCFDCHGDGVKKGELDLDRFSDIPSMQADREVWKRIRLNLEQHLMPPPDEYQPAAEERQAWIDWIDAAVFPVDPDHPDPGRVTLRRLNRIEYQNTLRDLLGIDLRVVELLPPDDSGYGFDTIGDVLTLSPAHLDKYLDAARLAVGKAVHLGPMPFPKQKRLGRKLGGDGRADGNGKFLHTNGVVSTEFSGLTSGRYRLEVKAGGTRGPSGAPTMRVEVDGQSLGEITATASMENPEVLVMDLAVEGSDRAKIALHFINDSWDEKAEPEARDTNLRLESVALVGPLDGPRLPKPASHRRIFGEGDLRGDQDEEVRRIFRDFARRAFRRPVEAEEIDRYLGLFHALRSEEMAADEAVAMGLETMLVSPSFLYREEPQPEPDEPGSVHEIGEHALASRLSYFLWSTMPDERLMMLADEGKLREQWTQEVERMVASDRISALVSNFGGQWLQLRDLAASRPSPRFFRDFDLALRGDMRRETEHFLGYLLREDRPVTELLNASYSFLNERLAHHYGIAGVEGPEFRLVDLEGTPRRGLLGQGSFHLLTSLPTRTSPVMRGKYVLENLLDTPPPPPPPNVPQLDPPQGGGKEHLSLREQMEKHRQDPNCSACHALMDPIGFGLENFDADGTWRTEDHGKPLDVSGELVGGRAFTGAGELREILVREHREELLRSVASKILTYALGRGTDWYDKPALDRILAETEATGGGFRAMIHAVTRSVPFQKRRGDG